MPEQPGYLDTFKTRDKFRNWVRNSYIPGLAPGTSRTAALAGLKNQGWGYRKQTFLDDFRTVFDLRKYEESIRDLPGSNLVPKAWMAKVSDKRLNQAAQYRFHVQIWDMETGETKWIERAIATNKHLTKQDAEDRILGWSAVPLPESDYVVTTVELYEVWVKDTDKLQYIY